MDLFHDTSSINMSIEGPEIGGIVVERIFRLAKVDPTNLAVWRVLDHITLCAM